MNKQPKACPEDKNGWHSFRDGEAWLTHCRLCGLPRFIDDDDKDDYREVEPGVYIK